MIDYIDFLKKIIYPTLIGIMILLFSFYSLVYFPEPLPLLMFIVEILVVSLIPFGYVYQISRLYFKNELIRYSFLLLTSLLFFYGFMSSLIFLYENQIDWYVPIATELVALIISISVVPITLILLSFPFKLIDVYVFGTRRLYYKYGIHDAIQDNELIDVENDIKHVDHLKEGNSFFWQPQTTNKLKNPNISYKKMDVTKLKQVLEEKVKNEEYEEAAKIRDILYKREKR